MKKNSTFRALLLAFTAIFAVSPLTAAQPSFFVRHKKKIIVCAILVTSAATLFYFRDALLGKKSVVANEPNDGIVIFPEDTVKQALNAVKRAGNIVKDTALESSKKSAIEAEVLKESKDTVDVFSKDSVDKVLNHVKQVGTTVKDTALEASQKSAIERELLAESKDSMNIIPEGFSVEQTFNNVKQAANDLKEKAVQPIKGSTMGNMDQQIADFQKEHNLKKSAQV